MLHVMHQCRLDYIKMQLPSLNGLTVLDYGCGGGLLSESLCQLGATVMGMDMNSPSIEVAKQHAQQEGLQIDYQNGTIDDLGDEYFSSKAFDIVFALECLEHIRHPKRLIKSLSGALKNGGYMVISTLNRNITSYLLGIIAAEQLLGWVEPGTHDHHLFIKPSEMRKMCSEHGLQLKDLSGMSFDTKTQAFSITNDVSLNYIMVFKKDK